MVSRNLALGSLFAFALILCGCGSSGEPPAATKPAKEPEAVSGQMAAFRMFSMARRWAPDALMLRMEDLEIPEVKGGAGRSGAWRAIFVSPKLGQQREYTFAAQESKSMNVHADVFAWQPASYTPSPQWKPFHMAALRIDSTRAWELAAKESAEYMRKHPDTPVHFELGFTALTANASWRVVWGPSVSRSDYSIFIDASTGFFVRRSR